MSLRKLGTALFVVLALGAVLASSALAAGEVETKSGEQWYTGTTATNVTTLAADQAVTATIAEHPEIGAKAQLKGEIAGLKVQLTATGIECVGCNITNEEITSTAGKVAFGKGQIKFTGVTADAPTGCTVRNKTSAGTAGVIETEPLKVHGDWVHKNTTNKKAFLAFIPQSGTLFATVYLEGGNCEPIKGSYKVTGTVFGESANERGVMATGQKISFSPAIQTTTGSELKLGANVAELTGSATFSAGGKYFGIKP